MNTNTCNSLVYLTISFDEGGESVRVVYKFKGLSKGIWKLRFF